MDIYREVCRAEQRIRPYILKTPLERAPALGAAAFLKLENRQHTGSFKVRGALNKLLSLAEAGHDGEIVTASSGNHALAVAFALQKTGLRGTIFLPETVARVKLERLRALDVALELRPGDSGAAEAAAREQAAKGGMVYVSPYNDAQVVGGQGTIGVELLEQLPGLDSVVVAVGGGGLVSGLAGYLKQLKPALRVIGVEPENSAAMSASVDAGRVVQVTVRETLSDGTAGNFDADSITFEPCLRLVDDWVRVSEAAIVEGLRWAYAQHALVIEGAAGAAIAAYRQMGAELADRQCAVIVCGGNIDARQHRELLEA